jgi:hypothetical protein
MKHGLIRFYGICLALAAVAAFCQNPTVRITSPADRTRFQACSDILVSVEAAAVSGTIKKVELYENGAMVRAITRSPYDFTRTSRPDGVYRYCAKATDSNGQSATSDTVIVLVGSVAENNLIMNGEFNCSASPWRLDQYVGAVAAFTVVPDLYLTDDSSGAYIDIQNIGTETWAVQLMQPFKVLKGHVYEISFTAETNEAKEITVNISQDYDPYAPLWAQTVVVSQWGVFGPYTYECTADDPKTMFKFVVGGNLIPISIDAVKVIDTTAGGTGIEPSPVPAGFELAPNFPNPFNPDTRIQYVIPNAGHVRLTVFDPMGRAVAGFERMETAGGHSFAWNGRDFSGATVPSGMYIVRLENGSRSQSRKMMLVR